MAKLVTDFLEGRLASKSSNYFLGSTERVEMKGRGTERIKS